MEIGIHTSPTLHYSAYPAELWPKEAVHDRLVPNRSYGRHDSVRQFVVRPSPRMDAGAERNWPDFWHGIELGK